MGDSEGWSRGPFASFQMSLERGKMEYLPVQKHHALDSFTEDTPKNVDQDVQIVQKGSKILNGRFLVYVVTVKVEDHLRAAVYCSFI